MTKRNHHMHKFGTVVKKCDIGFILNSIIPSNLL